MDQSPNSEQVIRRDGMIADSSADAFQGGPLKMDSENGLLEQGASVPRTAKF